MPAVIEFGNTIDEGEIVSGRARAVAVICSQRDDFRLLEVRRTNLSDVGPCDILVVECVNDGVPSRNRVGIKVREPLALVFPHSNDEAPQARALRNDFPVLPHMNHGEPHSPLWLCLYAEPWTEIRRQWTPQRFLGRILWWLTQSSKRTLHALNQPVEQMFFDSPIEIILPSNFYDLPPSGRTSTQFEQIKRNGAGITLVASSLEDGKHQFHRSGYLPIIARTDAVVHGMIERFPATLGELDDQLRARGSSLRGALSRALVEQIPSNGIPRREARPCLIVLAVPLRRTHAGMTEAVDVRGFVVDADAGALGVSLGVARELSDRYFATPLIGDAAPQARDEWRERVITPVSVKTMASRAYGLEASGVAPAMATFRGVLAGVGALGSALAELWSREGWGEWTFVDRDHVQPHNVVRHVATGSDLGRYKVDVVKERVDAIYRGVVSKSIAIPSSVLDPTNKLLEKALAEADLLVDATTTLDVPRQIARSRGAYRACSVFLTPSGAASVLLIEDAIRSVRLDVLEPQYYRAVLRSDWGSRHLGEPAGQLWVGAGCRDVSGVLSLEQVHLHAAIVARSVRSARARPDASIRVWIADDGDGSVRTANVVVRPTHEVQREGWRIVSDDDVEQTLIRLRLEHAPSETGGIVLGYADHVARTVYVVDVLPAPPDSRGDQAGFTRGVAGLESQVAEAQRRTRRIVGYIGEWHSHPPMHRADASAADRRQLTYLAGELARDGEPALMVIVGADREVKYLVEDGTSGAVPSASAD